MKQISEKEWEARQKWAYENRDSIQPGDLLHLKCTEADRQTAAFALPHSTLTTCQEPGKAINKGDIVRLRCTAAALGRNGYGPFVDYVFHLEETGHTVRINGPEAQELAGKKLAPAPVKNRDIPVLADVLSLMQEVRQIEQRRGWQHERMNRMTQSITGMPGGGGLPQGLDSAFAALDEIDREQGEKCREYARQLRRAQRILDGIVSQSMRSFVVMKYVMGCSNAEIMQELNMTRRGLERARRSIESAGCMAEVQWQERYVVE